MHSRQFFLLILGSATVCRGLAQTAIPVEGQTLSPIVVTATRSGQAAVDLPVSIDSIGRAAIRDGQLQVNLSESLMRVPGLVAQNRQNYAQDLQISIRGSGARSTFGVRGVRLYTDGIPATMPDGQGQVSHVDLGSADRIEVMRGPFSALYGNSSGGVIAIFTEEGQPGVRLDADTAFGSDGVRRLGLKASGKQGNVGYVASASHFSMDGYRIHSAAGRDTQNARLRIAVGDDALLTVTGNAIRMNDVQDPLGLSRAQFAADPRAVDPLAMDFNTRKSVEQHQFGLTYEHFLDGGNSISVMLYGGQRNTTQFQAIPVAAQAAPTSAGGVIDLSRDYQGGDLRWSRRMALAGKPLRWTMGLSYDRLAESRRGSQNFIGATLGIQGALRRNEDNLVWNVDQYAQAQWEPHARWLLLAGVRNSTVHVASKDHYIGPGNGDDSGTVSYHALMPVLGATFKATPDVNVYASYGKGFETPTFNELSYRSINGTQTGLNLDLAAAKSNNAELGLKARLGKRMQGSMAVFHIITKNELTVLANAGGRAVYQNAASTRRDGIEARLDGAWGNGMGLALAYTLLRATYTQSFCNGPCAPATTVAAGSRLPGVPGQTLYGELSWRQHPDGFHVALEGRYSGKVYVDDLNSDAASAYFIASLRAGLERKLGSWTLKGYARIDNLANRRYAGSVIVNESNRRFFEPAPGRTWLAGVGLSHSW